MKPKSQPKSKSGRVTRKRGIAAVAREKRIGKLVEVKPRIFDPDLGVLRLKVKLAADREAVDPVVQAVMKMVRQIEYASGKEDAVELALSEALANAVVHGAKGDATKIVECDVSCDEKQGIFVVVRDPGNGFNPAHIPSPLEGQNIYAGNGRGIYLINQLMDQVEFHRNGTEIHMRKR